MDTMISKYLVKRTVLEKIQRSNRFIYLVFMLVMLFCFNITTTSLISAAPDPAEVEKLKRNAPIQIIGTVIKDELEQDLATQKDLHQQLRRMTISVDEWVRVPNDDRKSEVLEVVYTYIPSWQTNLYTGGHSMDITVGDVVEVWLEEGEFGLEPVLGGNTVNHIVYVDNRIEPIPEPFVHKLMRKLNQLWDSNSSMFVLVSMIAFVSILIITNKRD